jgi:hypothetical protein
VIHDGAEEAFTGGRVPGERGRITAPGRRTDGAGDGTLVVIQETEGTWVFYPPIGECGVRISAKAAVGLAESILRRARLPEGTR